MQWRQAGETRFATPVSRISGLPRAGILRFTARLGISLQTGLPYAGIWPAAWLRISARTGLPRAGIWPTAWLGISVRTGLLRPLEPAIRAGQRLIAPSPECPRPAPSFDSPLEGDGLKLPVPRCAPITDSAVLLARLAR